MLDLLHPINRAKQTNPENEKKNKKHVVMIEKRYTNVYTLTIFFKTPSRSHLAAKCREP